jgi:hypothetical protein
MPTLARRIFLRKWWTFALASLAAFGLLLSLIVHVAAYFSARLLAETEIWVLVHAFCIAMCVLTFPFSRRMEKLWGRGPAGQNRLGRKGRKVIEVLGAYAVLNFLLLVATCMIKGENRVAERDGKYYAIGFRIAEQEITREQFLNHRLRVVRGFSGGWLVFFAWPTVFFLNLKPIDLFAPEPQPIKPPRRRVRT